MIYQIGVNLNNVVTILMLEDVSASNIHLTWCNKQEDDIRIFIKLDRVVNEG